MGIPYYFYSLTQKYNNIISNNKPLDLNIYCIDFNGIIHNVAQDIIKKYKDTVEKANNDNIESEIIEGVWNRIQFYIETYKAEKYIICADGVAPLAKMFQQRKRRYLNIYKNVLDNVNIIWDTNAITPGTLFMEKLNTYIRRNINDDSNKNNVIYSGSNECGEGEHKIFKMIKDDPIDDRIIIHGLDADLIILSLMSHRENIYLMREMKDPHTNNTVYNYLNIKELRKAILCELKTNWDISSETIDNDNDLIDTYCTACSILGNDFIPHLLTIELKNNGIDTLLSATKRAIKTNGLLVVGGVINHNCLINIFKDLANSEDEDIHTICERYIKKRPPDNKNTPSDYYGLKNKDPLIHTIYNSPNKWRQEYYRIIFDNNISIDSTVMFNACNNYIKGIYWVYSYYKGMNIDCEWYYPYNYPPTIKDILNHSIANEVPILNNDNDFVPSYIQLLIVLPKYSINLLSKKHQRYMMDIYSGLFHMYPVKYNIQTFLKTQLWECSPILPLINLNYMRRVLELENKY
jgi:5'-3' exonuclease|uniref:Xrn1 N-terminal domain-containing protein n=1 Tax=viral metagenome TaxID=1070528 RepID=A0A6C0LWN2_9ZZZZ